MRLRALLVSAWLLLLLVLTVNGQTQRNALRGVPPITGVVIEDISRDAVSGGLTKDQLQRDVELRLRKAGIRISDKAESFLYVRIGAIKTAPCTGFAINAFVVFNRPATLDIGKGSTSLEVVSVWSRTSLITSPPSDFERSTRETVADLVDRFLNDYLAANPKP